MKIVLHIGAHSTDDNHLISCLRKNVDALAEQGIAVPDPLEYRPVIREVFKAPKDDALSADSRELVMDAILANSDDPDRLVLSHDAFVSVAGNAIKDNKIYPSIGQKMRRFQRLFEGFELEILLGLKDPATFVPALFDRSPETKFSKFIAGTNPAELQWSDTVTRLKQELPDVPLTVWCNEDAPLIWPELLMAMANHDEFTILEGEDDFLRTIMMWRGLKRMKTFMESTPPNSAKQRRLIVGSFLEKFPLGETMNTVIELPGWTEDFVNTLTAQYYRDVEAIEAMDNVTFISPFD